MAVDLYEAGLTKLSTGACLEKYKDKIKKGCEFTGSGIRGGIHRVRGLCLDSDEESEESADEESSDAESLDEDEMEDVEEDEDTF
jgi:hypothetical protein